MTNRIFSALQAASPREARSWSRPSRPAKASARPFSLLLEGQGINTGCQRNGPLVSDIYFGGIGRPNTAVPTGSWSTQPLCWRETSDRRSALVHLRPFNAVAQACTRCQNSVTTPRDSEKSAFIDQLTIVPLASLGLAQSAQWPVHSHTASATRGHDRHDSGPRSSTSENGCQPREIASRWARDICRLTRDRKTFVVRRRVQIHNSVFSRRPRDCRVSR